MRNFKIAAVIILCFAMVLSGCSLLNQLPEEYVKGVKVPRDYPDDDLEIYDDAIVYETEDDDEEITIKYGTTDDLDDVIDFFEDMFEDNDLTVDESEDDKDEYYAKGSGDGFIFEVNVEEPRGEYEEKAFETVVEVYVEFVETPVDPDIPDADSVGAETLKKMQGFWIQCGMDGDIQEAYKLDGMACEFNGMKMDAYTLFELVLDGIDFTFIDDNTINYIDEGESTDLNIEFQTIGGIEYMLLSFDNDPEKYYFEKSTYNELLMYEDMGGDEGGLVALDDEMSDADLEFWASDVNWYFAYYIYADGTIEYAEVNNRLFLGSDYTGVDEYTDYYDNITWYIMGGNLYITYPDGEVYWPVDYEYDGYEEYLYLYDLEEGFEGGAWVFTLTQPYIEEVNNTDSGDGMVYLTDILTDSDLEYYLYGYHWDMTYVMYTDGTYDYSTSYNRITLNYDYTGEDAWEDGSEPITWYVVDSIIYFVYADGSSDYYMVDYEYDGTDVYMYLFDPDLGYDDTALVYVGTLQ